ncbi:MAG: ATP-binding protein [Lachnospiraceae bacterium]|nr:ATP-binding protein [Lachnospiraceae bacterium]
MDTTIPFEDTRDLIYSLMIQLSNAARTLAARPEREGYAGMGTAAEPKEPSLVEGWNYIRSRMEAAVSKGADIPLLLVREKLSLSDFQFFLLSAAMAPDIDPAFLYSFAELDRDGERARCSLWLARRLYSLFSDAGNEDVFELFDREHPLNAVLLTDWRLDGASALLERPLAIRKTAFEYIMGADHIPDGLGSFCSLREKKKDRLFHQEETAERCVRFLNETKKKGIASRLLYLYGAPGCGKRFILSQVLPGDMLEVDAGYILSHSEEDRRVWEGNLITWCLFRGITPCLVINEPADREDALIFLLRRLRRFLDTVCLCTDRPLPGIFSEEHAFFAEIKAPGNVEQQSLWEHFAKREKLTAVSKLSAGLAGTYNLLPDRIRQAVIRLSHDLPERAVEADIRDLMSDILFEEARGRLNGMAKPIEGGFKREDLVLPEAQTRMLDFVIQVVKLRHQVTRSGGFDKKLPYGRGVSVLLYGPPGTGKTMTAQVLARETGLRLFQVDTSRIMDKYVGETEKKLGELFDQARNINAILFFDEADALFAKRTEVAHSNDKYANAETAYLLQRMEQYDGVIVLATNHKNNFDEAFFRRITYIIQVPMPDEETRAKIWRGIFPPETEVAGDVDFDELASLYELSGSNIKYIAIEAAFAAAILGTPVDRSCILTALKLDAAKASHSINRIYAAADKGLI